MDFPPVTVDGRVVSVSTRRANQVLITSSTGRSHIFSERGGSERISVTSFDDILLSEDEVPIASSFSHAGDSYSVMTSSSRLLTRGEHSNATSVDLNNHITSSSAERWVLHDQPVSLEPLYDNSTCSLIGFGRGAVLWDERTSHAAWSTEPLPPSRNEDGSGTRVVGAVSVQGPVVVVATFDGFVLSYDVRSHNQPIVVAQIEHDTLCCMSAQPQQRSVVLGGALGKAYVCRGTHSTQIEQCITTGPHRSVIRCIAANSQQVFCGSVSGRLSASMIDDGSNSAGTGARAVTTVASIRSLLGSGYRKPLSTSDSADVAVSAVCVSDSMAWAAFSSCDGVSSTVVGVAANAATGIVTLF